MAGAVLVSGACPRGGVDAIVEGIWRCWAARSNGAGLSGTATGSRQASAGTSPSYQPCLSTWGNTNRVERSARHWADLRAASEVQRRLRDPEPYGVVEWPRLSAIRATGTGSVTNLCILGRTPRPWWRTRIRGHHRPCPHGH